MPTEAAGSEILLDRPDSDEELALARFLISSGEIISIVRPEGSPRVAYGPSVGFNISLTRKDKSNRG